MPFTFSHPAAVLPLTYLPKRFISLTGLVVGSVTPDFEYFIRMNIQSKFSHSFAGLFWFDLPLGIALTFIFHNMVRDSLFDNLPLFLKQRIITFTEFDWNAHFRRNWFVIMISILIGALSHILWDGFTHEHGYFVKTISALRNPIELRRLQIPVYNILQHVSTVVGGIIIAFAFFKWAPDKTRIPRSISRYWSISILITILITAIRLTLAVQIIGFSLFVITCISAGLIALILTPVLLKLTPGPL